MAKAKLLVLVGLVVQSLCGQEAPDTVPGLTTAARQAYQAKDYARFLALEKRMLALDPQNPRFLYNAACGEALLGRAKESAAYLELLAARKIDLGAEEDGDFAGIRDSPDWKQYQSALTALRMPLVRSKTAFTLPDPGLLSAGIAVDPATGDVYIASVRERKIVHRSTKGEISDFITSAQDGFLAGSALAVDRPRGLLYASTSAVPFMLNSSKDDVGKTGVFAFDLKTGKLARKAVLAATDPGPHYLNNMAVDRRGNVYVADSAGSGVYLLPYGKDALETFLAPNALHATQGLTFSADEKTLYVASFTDGLWAMDMATKSARQIPTPAGTWLFGMDGISRVNDGFVVVQIMVQPNRVLHLKWDATRTKISSVEILEMNHIDYNGPIQGALDGNSFLYIANSQFNLANPETGVFATDKAKPTVVLRLPLP